MENQKHLANFQMLDNYVKECNIKVLKKYLNSPELINHLNMGFSIINIDKRSMTGQIELKYIINVLENNESVANIELTMDALFKGQRGLSDEDFDRLLKFNGAPILSTICRAYISNLTLQSGIPAVILPLINFEDFFKNAVEEKL